MYTFIVPNHDFIAKYLPKWCEIQFHHHSVDKVDEDFEDSLWSTERTRGFVFPSLVACVVDNGEEYCLQAEYQIDMEECVHVRMPLTSEQLTCICEYLKY